MKKLLAYSTMSHCGFLMLLVGCSNFYVLITYLFLHGFYKAATFYCAGSFIRIYGSQDTRVMGASNKLFIADTMFLLLCAANLSGLPLTIGILYKNFFFNLILNYGVNFFVIGFSFIGMLSGVVYFYRLVFYTVFDLSKWTNLGLYEILETVTVEFRIYNKLVNKTHFIATTCLFFASFIFYFILLWVIQCGDVEYNVGIYNQFVTTFLFSSLTNLFLSHLVYFYFFYLVLVALIVFISWRYQYV